MVSGIRTNWFLLVAIFVVSCKKNTENFGPNSSVTPTLQDDDPILPGNPTDAQSNISFSTNFLKSNGNYKIGYNALRGSSMWVAWHLQSEDLGITPRQNDFREDANLPGSYYLVMASSYIGSGFDRGHNCPSADRTSSISNNSATFLMSNMIPEAPTLNQGPWAGLESFIRNSLVGTTKEAYIITGSFGAGGYNYSGNFFTTIDSSRVTVPKKIWKVVLVLPKGSNDLKRIDTSVTILAVDMPNDNRLYTTWNTTAWRNYVTTVAALEADANSYGEARLDLFKNISALVRNYLKAKLYE